MGMPTYGSVAAALDDFSEAGEGALRAGRAGEQATAAVLSGIPGVTVLHSLKLPGWRGDIDHVVVSGRNVWPLDSKCWAPGTYWRLGRHTFRGFRGAPWAGKRTAAMSAGALARHLGPRARVQRPLVVVWPSSRRGALRIWYRPYGMEIVPGPELARSLRRLLGRRPRPADPDVVAALRALVVGR